MIFLNLKREREGREKKHPLGAFFGTSERKSYPLLDNIETSTEKKKKAIAQVVSMFIGILAG